MKPIISLFISALALAAQTTSTLARIAEAQSSLTAAASAATADAALIVSQKAQIADLTAKLVALTPPARIPVPISVKFVGSGAAMGPAEKAGVQPLTSWNNAPGAASAVPLNLVADTGLASGAAVTWTADNPWINPVTDAAGNLRLMSGYLDNSLGKPSTITVTNLAPGAYSVFVYADGDNGGAKRTGTYRIDTTSLSATDQPSSTFSGVFTLGGNGSNYVVFSGMTLGPSFTLTATPGESSDGQGRAPVNGMQIVPSSMVVQLAATATASIYLAPGGNDAAAGAIDTPVKTLGRAIALVRGSAIKTVTVRAGTYSIPVRTDLTAADNDTKWIAYPGEKPVFDGGGTGVLNFADTKRMTIEGLTFRNMAYDGLFLNFADAMTFRGNTFLKCIRACLIGNYLTNSVIERNTIDGQSPGNPPGSVANGYTAISLMGTSSGNRIAYNSISNTEGGGIGIGEGPTQAGSSNNVMDHNVLKNILTNVFDFGALYIYNPSHSGTGNKITNNVVDGYGGPNGIANEVRGIYLDDMVSNVLVSGNVVRGNGAYALQLHGGDHNTITDNIWDLSNGGYLSFNQSSPIGAFGMSGNVFSRNLVYSGGGFRSSLHRVILNPGDGPMSASNNLYYSSSGATIPNVDIVDSKRILANPLFASPTTGNYSMPASSPAYTQVGFVPIP